MILAIETSTPRASLALFENESVRWENDFTTRRSHNSKIFSPVKEALEIAGDALEMIVVGIGPGSYSGVRVGISVANGLGFARNVPVIGLSSMAAFPTADCTIISDARRKTYSAAMVKNRELIGEPDLIDAAEFPDFLKQLNGPVFTADSHVAEEFEGISLEFPTAAALARTAALCEPETIAKLAELQTEPHYLRPPFITVAKKKPVFRK